MAKADFEMGEDRAVIFFDGHGPVALEDMTDAFAALARIYARHFEPSRDETNPKLYVSRLSSGSIEAEIVPLLMVVGGVIPYMDGAIIVRDFTRWVGTHIRHFAGMGTEPATPISREDASDLREFIKPIAGKRGAQLGLKHARYSEKTADREVIAEFDFEEAQSTGHP